jgi:hypothetical protein
LPIFTPAVEMITGHMYTKQKELVFCNFSYLDRHVCTQGECLVKIGVTLLKVKEL